MKIYIYSKYMWTLSWTLQCDLDIVPLPPGPFYIKIELFYSAIFDCFCTNVGCQMLKDKVLPVCWTKVLNLYIYTLRMPNRKE